MKEFFSFILRMKQKKRKNTMILIFSVCLLLFNTILKHKSILVLLGFHLFVIKKNSFCCLFRWHKNNVHNHFLLVKWNYSNLSFWFCTWITNFFIINKAVFLSFFGYNRKIEEILIIFSIHFFNYGSYFINFAERNWCLSLKLCAVFLSPVPRLHKTFQIFSQGSNDSYFKNTINTNINPGKR